MLFCVVLEVAFFEAYICGWGCGSSFKDEDVFIDQILACAFETEAGMMHASDDVGGVLLERRCGIGDFIVWYYRNVEAGVLQRWLSNLLQISQYLCNMVHNNPTLSLRLQSAGVL
jgi:hypothetical protein